ncbi:hypothetical protein FACS1894159_02160 [Bacteroidia bacterium]|nr:hypothetical protein FACS1894159_02160 [Bacteroidia bacterium]
MFAGCSVERLSSDDDQGARLVKIEISIPGHLLPGGATRAMSAAAENDVRTIDVVVFDASVSPQTFVEHARGGAATVTQNVDGSYTATFDVQLRAGASRNLVIVANAGSEVESALTGMTTGAAKKIFLDDLTFARTGAWPSAAGSYAPIPMYGETGPVAIAHGSSVSGVRLRRMLGRIDVLNDPSASGIEITQVLLCNYNTVGNIAPRWNNDGAMDNSLPLQPNLPSSPGKQTGAATATGYPATASAQDMEGVIYAFEAQAASDAVESQRHDATCLVIRGRLTGSSGNEQFYRVDFTFDGTTTGTTRGDYMPLLRNHKYVVNIDRATGPGYVSAQEAIDSYTVQSNLRTNIISYDAGEYGGVDYNGKYWVGVGQRQSAITREVQTMRMKCFTNCPTGWIATIAGTPGWLSFASGNSNESGAANDAGAGFVLQAAANNSGVQRSAEILVTAGATRLKVTVVQTADATTALRLLDGLGAATETLNFGYNVGGVVAAKSLHVAWATQNLSCTAIATPGAPPFVHAADSDNPVGTWSGGYGSFSIRPMPGTQSDVTGAVVKSTEVTFRLNDGQGWSIEKTIVLRQGPP